MLFQLTCKVVSVAGIGHRQMPWQEALGQLNYTTMKLGKQVGFSAGSTMMGNLGQGHACCDVQMWIEMLAFCTQGDTGLNVSSGTLRLELTAFTVWCAGNYVAANSVNDIFPALNRPEILGDSQCILKYRVQRVQHRG